MEVHYADAGGAGREIFLDVARPDLGDGEVEELLDTLRSGWLTAGPKVSRFQDGLARYVGAPYVRALNSCTAGLTLALRLLDVGSGDEVLLPANTFVACANAIEHAGARPVLVDCEPATGLIDLAHAATLLGPQTRAIMPVHLGGRPLDRDALSAFGERHSVAVIEDAAHAIGAAWRERPVGSWGNLCSFSFHATKNLTTFEGGALVVRSSEEAERVERLALHGLSRSSWNRHTANSPHRYDVTEPGFKFGMTDVSAAVGLHQLRRLDVSIERRDQLSRCYDELLAGLPVDTPPQLPPSAHHARHLYTVMVHPEAPLSRDELISALRVRNIGSTVHFQGIHLHTYYGDKYGIRPEELPASTDWAQRSMTLPLHAQMTVDDVDDVANALSAALRSARAAA
jgi:dTDP-4-amino-4,6-dideoxygalactose transaminase